MICLRSSDFGHPVFEVMNMNAQLTSKESQLLKELKGQEELCIQKYSKGAQCAVDGQLKGLFSRIAQIEQEHLDTLTKIENGTAPQPPQGGNQATPTFTEIYGMTESPDKQNDCYLWTDALNTEKHASGLYNTCVFEFQDENTRKLLNHIQTEEQNHGKMLYDYMKTNHMYH